ncbi:hypothetical protein CRG98_039892 [Punica granatum]|nr:hypothetical protein CRG98_039892 [Punica granatum]
MDTWDQHIELTGKRNRYARNDGGGSGGELSQQPSPLPLLASRRITGTAAASSPSPCPKQQEEEEPKPMLMPIVVMPNNSSISRTSCFQIHNNGTGRSSSAVRYRECQKNHAASIGGNATDGCGEFMPSGEEGSNLDALKCSACNCHRNFHRKVEVKLECSRSLSPCPDYGPSSSLLHNIESGKSIISLLKLPATGAVRSHGSPPMLTADSDRRASSVPLDLMDDAEKVKKRFRTKFTPEQKERMLAFADKANWKIQKLDDSVVQQFCRDIGIERRVLKVWMHNNKHTFAKKTSTT